MPIKKLMDQINKQKFNQQLQNQNPSESGSSQGNSQPDSQTNVQASSKDNPDSLSMNLQENLQRIQSVFEESSDLVIREFKIGANESIKAFIVMLNGLIDEKSVNTDLINPLMSLQHDIKNNNALAVIKESSLSVAIIKESGSFDEVTNAVLSGDTVLFIEESNIALMASLRGWEARGVSEPKTEAVVRGPREGFVESLGTNKALLRRKMKNSALKFWDIQIGRQTKTTICVAYLKGIANEKVVNEVKNRLQRIDTDSILESGYIESFIEDAPFSLFPTVGNSEKPDIVSAKLLEGRVAIKGIPSYFIYNS